LIPSKRKIISMTDGVISWKEWEEKYIPVDVTCTPLENSWDCMFEDINKVHQTARSPYYVWTLVDNNPNSVYLDVIPGYRVFNRMGYFVTQKPWTDENLVVSNDKSYS
jgi:hypothetical protein